MARSTQQSCRHIFSETIQNSIAQHERIEAFKRKLRLWKTITSSGTTDKFEQMHAFILGNNMDFSVIKRQVTVHLSWLLDTFNSYFSEHTQHQAASYQWIANPFTENIEELFSHFPIHPGIFSATTALKTTYRARWTIEIDIFCLSKISPRIGCVISRHQQQSSQ